MPASRKWQQWAVCKPGGGGRGVLKGETSLPASAELFGVGMVSPDQLKKRKAIKIWYS